MKIEENSILTEEKEIKTLVMHVLIDNHFIISMNATSDKLNKIHMLQFRNENQLGFKLNDSLS